MTQHWRWQASVCGWTAETWSRIAELFGNKSPILPILEWLYHDHARAKKEYTSKGYISKKGAAPLTNRFLREPGKLFAEESMRGHLSFSVEYVVSMVNSSSKVDRLFFDRSDSGRKYLLSEQILVEAINFSDNRITWAINSKLAILTVPDEGTRTISKCAPRAPNG